MDEQNDEEYYDEDEEESGNASGLDAIVGSISNNIFLSDDNINSLFSLTTIRNYSLVRDISANIINYVGVIGYIFFFI